MNQETLIEILRPRMLYEALADAIREQIFRHELVPGDPLDEFRLAKQFVVSRTPIREALKVLASEGIVELQARRGCFVARLTWEDVLKLFDLLELLETFAVREAAKAQVTLVPGEEFQRNLAAAAGNSFLPGLIERLVAKLRLAFGPQFASPKMQPSPAQQSALAQALGAGDANEALRLQAEQASVRRYNGQRLFALASQNLADAASSKTVLRQDAQPKPAAHAGKAFIVAEI